MLDTRTRKYIQPMFDKSAQFFIDRNISATKVTCFAVLFGLIAAVFVVFNFKVLAIIFLWISGYLDALDGSIARITNSSSKLGAFLDIVFDRVVEIAILLSLTFINENIYKYVMVVFAVIILSMTIFLTSGSLIDKESNKAFYYQAGLAERTEGFIMLSLAIMLQSYVSYVLIIFAIMISITIIQRFVQSVKILKGYEQ